MQRSAEQTAPDHFLGFGLRLRKEYLHQVVDQWPDVDWFEVITESFIGEDEHTLGQLEQIRSHYPIVLHGLSLHLGSPWPLDMNYLAALKAFKSRFAPAWISDHLCWQGADSEQGGMLPLPYSAETLENAVSRINRVQEYLGERILLENVSPDRAGNPEMSEVEFITGVVEQSDSLILIDIENLHVSSINLGFDAEEYLNRLPAGRVRQIHLAGSIALCRESDEAEEQVIDPVWELYTRALARFGYVTTMVEREDTIPPLGAMVEEVTRARCGALEFLRQAQ